MRTLVLAGIAVFGCLMGAQAQNKADLQKERDAIQAKIATTEKLLNQTATNKKDALVQLRLVNERMNLREQLMRAARILPGTDIAITWLNEVEAADNHDGTTLMIEDLSAEERPDWPPGPGEILGREGYPRDGSEDDAQADRGPPNGGVPPD